MLVANAAATALFGAGLPGTNLVRRYAMADESIVNRPQVAQAALRRLRAQLRDSPHDDQLRALVGMPEGRRLAARGAGRR